MDWKDSCDERIIRVLCHRDDILAADGYQAVVRKLTIRKADWAIAKMGCSNSTKQVKQVNPH
ncbi:MAG: hypothetical protein V3V96_14350 [Acidiferrobacterales bacterium]